MSDGVNKVMLLGNLGQDPELRHTQNGNAVLTIRLATNETYRADNETKTRTEWHTVIVWGKRAEGLDRILQKGAQIFVEGRLATRAWEDKNGFKRYTTEVVATEIALCGSNRREEKRESSPPPGRGYDPDDDIPF